MMYDGWRFGGAGIWWLIGLLCMVALVVGIVWLATAATRRDRHQQPPWQPPYPGAGMTPPQPGAVPPMQPGFAPAPPRPNPHDILRERLAKGEITVEEFDRVRAALGPDPYGPPPAP